MIGIRQACWLWALCLLPACLQEPFPWTVKGADTSAEEEAVIRGAISYWNWKAGCTLLTWSNKGPRGIRHAPGVIWVRVVDVPDARWAGKAKWAVRSGGLIRIREGHMSVPVVAHEMGHLMGFSHNDPPVYRGVMNSAVGSRHLLLTEDQQSDLWDFCDGMMRRVR